MTTTARTWKVWRPLTILIPVLSLALLFFATEQFTSAGPLLTEEELEDKFLSTHMDLIEQKLGCASDIEILPDGTIDWLRYEPGRIHVAAKAGKAGAVRFVGGMDGRCILVQVK